MTDRTERLQRRVPHFPGDRITRTYDIARAFVSLGTDTRWKRQALDLVSPTQARHLDIGSGSGVLFSQGTDAPLFVGVDCELAMLLQSRHQRSSASLVVADMLALPFVRGSFGLVTMFNVLRYARDTNAALEAATDMLHKAGVLLIYDLSAPERYVLRICFYCYLITMTTIAGVVLHGNPTRFWHLWQSLANFAPARVVAGLQARGFRRVSLVRVMGGIVTCIVAEDLHE